MKDQTQKKFSCNQCQLQFGKKYVYDVHLSLIHDKTETFLNEFKSESEEICHDSLKCKQEIIETGSDVNLDEIDFVIEDKKEVSDNKTENGTEENKIIEMEGLQIVQKGQYSKCPLCEKSYKSTFIIRHIKLYHNTKEENFPCPDGCKRKFTTLTRRYMYKHLITVHKSTEPYVCKQCKKRFETLKNLNGHLAKHRAEKTIAQEFAEETLENSGNEGIFTCKFPGCGKFYSKMYQIKHHQQLHTGDMKFSCEVCNKKFYIHEHLKQHMNSHLGIEPILCRWKCGLTFATYGGRVKHERINHHEQNLLQSDCDICGKPCKDPNQLMCHRMTHLNPAERQEYRCSYCHIMFKSTKDRLKHEKRHQEGDNFACQKCDNQFTNEKNLANHVKNNHSDEKLKKSTKKSQRKTKNKSDIKSRIKSIFAEDITTDEKKTTKNTHRCHLCTSETLFTLNSLRRHLAAKHSTNFKCGKCDKCFQKEHHYTAHMEVHRLKECHLCGKVFARKQNADIHLVMVHKFNSAQLAEIGRWNPRNQINECPEYMTRKPFEKPKAKFSEIKMKKLEESRVNHEYIELPMYVKIVKASLLK